MTTTAPTTTGPTAPPEERKATRDTGHPIIGGVAAGLARHLGVPVLWVRAGFLVTAVLGGSGILFYAGLWLVLPGDPHYDRSTPGLESATRQGRRPGRIRRLADSGPAIALVALGLGMVLTAEAVFGNGIVIWALVLAVSASACCGVRPTRPSAPAGSTSRRSSTRSRPCSAAADGRRTSGSAPASCWWSRPLRCSPSVTAG